MEYVNRVHKIVIYVNHLFIVMCVFKDFILINLLVFVVKTVVQNHSLTLMDFVKDALKDVLHALIKTLAILANLALSYLISNALFHAHKNTLYLTFHAFLVELIVTIVKIKQVVLNVQQIITC